MASDEYREVREAGRAIKGAKGRKARTLTNRALQRETRRQGHRRRQARAPTRRSRRGTPRSRLIRTERYGLLSTGGPLPVITSHYRPPVAAEPLPPEKRKTPHVRSIRSCNNARRRATERRLNTAYFASLPRAILVPNGFEPRPAELGDIVKIGFVAEGVGMTEWMWAKVLEKDGSNYVVQMHNTANYSAMRAGTKVAITDKHILTTYENCPMRAANDLEPLGGPWGTRLETMWAVINATDLSVRGAVDRMLGVIDAAAKGETLDAADPVVSIVSGALAKAA